MAHRAIRITAVLKNNRHGRLMQALNEIGIDNLHTEAGRAPILEEERGIRSLLTGTDRIANEPVTVFSIYAPPESEDSILHLVADSANLHIPGMGVLYSEEITLYQSRPLCHPGRPMIETHRDYHMHRDAVGIYCLVQRGEGDKIARTVLEAGFAVPTITYGTGVGLRDRLGLLRITIPAEKEILTLVTASHDMESALELMIESGKLDRPGRGFINTFHVRRAILNTRLTRGQRSHAASMEQIISAIDSIKGNMEWRIRGQDAVEVNKRKFLKNLTEIRVRCDEGSAETIVRTAMETGAAGATISRARFADTGVDPDLENVPVAREVISFSVPENDTDTMVEAVTALGTFTESAHGTLTTHPVPLALTYIAQSG